MSKDLGKDLFTVIDLDGYEYVCYLWNSDKAARWVRRCQEIFFKPIAATIGKNIALDQFSHDEFEFTNMQLDVENGFNSFLNSVDEVKYVQYLKELIAGVAYKNTAINFESHFRGKMLHLHKLAYKILEFQLADFFDAVRGGASRYLSQTSSKKSKDSMEEKLNGESGDWSQEGLETQ